MRTKLGFLVLAAGVSAGAPAMAGEFAARVKPEGLNQLGAIASMKLPDSVPVPDYQKQLVDCPFTDNDTVAEVTDAELAVEVLELDLGTRDGVVTADVLLDVRAAASLDISRPYACLGSLSCEVGAEAAPVAIGLELSMGTGTGGVIELYDVQADLGLTGDDFDLDLDDCAVGDALEWVIDATDGWILSAVEGKLEELGEGLIADKIHHALADALPLHFETSGFALDAALTSLDIRRFDGLTVEADVAVSRVDGSAGASPETEAPEGPPFTTDFALGDFALAASDGLVTEALYQAWASGVFESELAMLAPSVELSEDGIAQKLGLPAGTRVDLALGLQAAPVVDFGRAGEGVRIRLDDLDVQIAIDSPGAEVSMIDVSAAASLGAGFGVDPVTGALVLEPNDLVVDHLEIRTGDSSLAADPERLRHFLRDVGTPLLRERLAETPIAPALSPADGLYVWLRKLDADRGWLRIGLDVHQPDPNDATAPSTTLVDPPAVVPAGAATLPVTGMDDTTPEPLLRFQATLDGEPIAEEPSFVHGVLVSAEEGEHTLEVAAVDLNGNVDPTPVRHPLVVDGTPPELAVTEEPPSVIVDGRIAAAWMASDDRGVVTTRWELLELRAGDTVGTVVREGESGAEGEISIDDADPDSLYVLRIIAEDEAGNASSEEYGFSFQQSGCAVGGGGGGLGACLLLLALGLLRSRRRGALASLAVAGLLFASSGARAQGVGTNLSGPTDADGASAFWNPAAMARGEGTRLDVGSALSLIRIDYQPDQLDAESNLFVPKPEPTLGAFTELSEELRLGFTVGVPSIAGARWDRQDGAAQITRYYAVSGKTFHITATTALSYQPRPWLSVGAGVTVVNSRFEADIDKDMAKSLNQSLGSEDPDAPFAYAAPALAAPVDLEADGWGLGGVAGVMLRPDDRLTIGTSLHLPTSADARGNLDATYSEAMRDFVEDAAPAAELPELSGKIDMTLEMPLMWFTAVAYEPAAKWEVRGDYRFVNRSSVANTDILVTEATSPDVEDTAIVRGYRDRHSVGARAARTFQDGRGVVALRGRYENSTVPERSMTPSNVDFQKVELGAVAFWRFTDRFAFTFQYSKFLMSSRDITTSDYRPLGEPSLDVYNKPSPTGRYEATSDYFVLSLSSFL